MLQRPRKPIGAGKAMVMLGEREFRPVTSACWDAGKRLEEMDRDGVDLQVMCSTPVLFAYARPVAQALHAAQVFNDAERDVEIVETTTNRIRYALALSVPGHSGSDPVAAAERLGALLAISDLLPEERMLITIQLRQAEALQILAAANADLTRRIDSAVAASDAESAQRLRTAQAENDRLRRELEDARTMLDALTSIERSISEREVQ